MGLLAAADARAAEWYLESELGQLFSYEENIGLDEDDTEGGQVSGFNSTSSIGLTAGGRTPVLDISLASLFNFTLFPTQSELNSNDQYITLTGTRQGERWTAALTGQFIRDTTRSSDVEDSGNFILANKRREFYSIGPELSYKLTSTHQVSFSAYYNYNHYDTREIPDSANIGGQAGWAHNLSPRTQATANVYASKINSNDTVEGNDNSKYYTLLVGANHQFLPNLKAGLAVGPNIAQTDVVETQDGTRRSESEVTPGYSFAADVTYALEERLSFLGNFSRALTQSTTTGTLNEDTRVGIAASYQLFPNLFFDLPLTYVHREPVGDEAEDEEDEARDYAAVEPTLRWRLAPDWDFRLGYGFQWQQRDDSSGFGNAVFAFLTYRLPRLAMSR
jgi:hypothetical protein